MTCIIDTSQIIPYSKARSTTSVSESDFYADDQRQTETKTKVIQHKHRKQRKREKIAVPFGSFLISLDKSCPSVKLNLNGLKERLEIKDLRMLLLSWLADGVRPPWIQLKKNHRNRRFVAVHVPGLDSSTFDIGWDSRALFTKTANLSKMCAYVRYMPFACDLFNEVIALKTTLKDHPAAEFCQCPISNSERQRRASAHRKSCKEYTPEQCILSLDEMLEGGYPIHSKLSGHNTPVNWVETRNKSGSQQDGQKEKHRLIALDCEMCLTEVGLELARISLIDGDLNIIMDEIVQPSHPILDYLTRYSGIREETLTGVTTTLHDIQQKLLDIIDQETILVGHSLECDLKTLRIAHPKVIDTSRLYHHEYGLPLRPSLKYLAARWLNRIIQTNEDTMPETGHDSRVDALVSMELVKLKLAQGPDFGHYFSNNESIFSRLDRCRPVRLGAMFETLGSMRPSPYTQRARLVRRCEDDDQLIDQLIESVVYYDFMWANLHELPPPNRSITNPAYIQSPTSLIQKYTNQYSDGETVSDASSQALADLDNLLRRLYNSLPTGTVLAVIGASKLDDRLSRSPPITPTSDSPDMDLNRQFNSFSPSAAICLLTTK